MEMEKEKKSKKQSDDARGVSRGASLNLLLTEHRFHHRGDALKNKFPQNNGMQRKVIAGIFPR